MIQWNFTLMDVKFGPQTISLILKIWALLLVSSKSIRARLYRLCQLWWQSASAICFCSIHLWENVLRQTPQLSFSLGLLFFLHIILCLHMDDLCANDFWQKGHLMSRSGSPVEDSVDSLWGTWKSELRLALWCWYEPNWPYTMASWGGREKGSICNVAWE